MTGSARRAAAVVALLVLLVAGCTGDDATNAEDAQAPDATEPAGGAQEGDGEQDAAAADGGGTFTPVAPEGFQVADLPDETADALSALSDVSAEAGVDLDFVSIQDEGGTDAAVLVITRYRDADVRAEADLSEIARQQAEATGGEAQVSEETIAGKDVVVAGTEGEPSFISWVHGEDTTVVLGSSGTLTLDQLRTLAAANIDANP